MREILYRMEEASEHCQAIADETRQKLVRFYLNTWFIPLTVLDPGEIPRVDVFVLVKMLEAMTDDLALVAALAEGAPLPHPEPLRELGERAALRGLIAKGPEALAHVQQIDEPALRNLVIHGLASSLRWLLEASESGPPGDEPVDLLLHATMLTEEVFKQPYTVAYMAAGKPLQPWL